MRLAIAVGFVLLLALGTARADDDECPRPAGQRGVREVKLRFADSITPEAFAVGVAALRRATRVILAIDGDERAVLARVDARQLAALDAGNEVSSEPIEPWVDFAGYLVDVSTRPRLEPMLEVAGWQLDASPRDAVPYVIKLRSPFTAASNEQAARIAARVGEAGLVRLDPGAIVRATMTRAQAAAIAAWSTVRWVGVVEPLYKIDPGLIGATCLIVRRDRLAMIAARLVGPDRIQVNVTVPDITAGVRSVLANAKATVIAEVNAGLVVELPRSAIRALARRAEVVAIELYAAPGLASPAAWSHDRGRARGGGLRRVPLRPIVSAGCRASTTPSSRSLSLARRRPRSTRASRPTSPNVRTAGASRSRSRATSPRIRSTIAWPMTT